MSAQAVVRRTKPARHRLSKVAGARDTIEGFGHGMGGERLQKWGRRFEPRR